jgi:hypothetical protein
MPPESRATSRHVAVFDAIVVANARWEREVGRSEMLPLRSRGQYMTAHGR